MLTIHTMTPFHHQYHRPQPANTMKKDQVSEKPATFQEILTQKMNEKNTIHIPR